MNWPGFNRRHWRFLTVLTTLGLLTWLFGFFIDLQSIYENLLRLGWRSGFVLFVFSVGILLAVTTRLRSVAAMLRTELGFVAALTATSSGQFYSLFSNQILGNMFGRYRIFSQHDSSSLKLASLTALEKLMTAGVAFGFAVLGGFYLADRGEGSNITTAHIDLVGISFSLAAMITIFAVIRRSHPLSDREVEKAAGIFNNWPRKLAGAGLSTLVSYALTAAAYSYLCRLLHPELGLLPILAATSLVIFLAALPLSVSGWGVREFAAIYAYGLIGIDLNDALTVSVLVGVTSTLTIVMSHTLLPKLLPHRGTAVMPAQTGRDRLALAFDRIVISVFSFILAVFVFFQFHIDLGFGYLNVNLADALALLAFTTVAGLLLFKRARLRWTITSVNWQLAVWSGVLVYGFGIGFLNFGLSEWALTGRLLGWFVLLGYLCCGILVVSYLGAAGVDVFFRRLLLSGALIVLIFFGLEISRLWGADPWPGRVGFSGFSANRNAFAYQLLFLCAYCLAFHGHNLGASHRALGVLFGLICAGVVYAGSRAGMISMLCLLVVALALRFTSVRALNSSLKYTLVTLGILFVAPLILDSSSFSLSSLNLPSFSGPSSNEHRWDIMKLALQMWAEQPFLGIGLGGFLQYSSAQLGTSTVIHSTPVWILVEFGLIAFIGLFTLGLTTVRQSYRLERDDSRNRLALLVIVLFLSFGLFHEIFYQRIFWLVVGMTLAEPMSSHAFVSPEWVKTVPTEKSLSKMNSR
jgi:O-antigen ligase